MTDTFPTKQGATRQDPTTVSDAIVIGSGPGGLSTAAVLAATGRKVTVLEHHDIAGGNCTVFRRKDYEFDVGVHYVGECGPDEEFGKFLGLLGLQDRISWRELDRDAFDNIVLPSGTFRVPADWFDYEARVVEAYPASAEAVHQYFTLLKDVAAGVRGTGDPGALLEWGLQTLRELFDHCGIDGEVEAILDHWSGLYGSGPSDTSVAVHALLVGHYMKGAYYPEGGGQVLAARFVELIEALGGEIHVKRRVARILVEDGAAIGVETENGEVHLAPLVISNADYKRTMLELLGEEHLDGEFESKVRNAEMTLPMHVAYVIVEGEIEMQGSRNFFIFSDESPEDYYETLKAGKLPNELFAYVSSATHKDPDNPHLAPKGFTNFQIMTLMPTIQDLWGVDGDIAHGTRYRREEDYRELKERVTDQLITQAEKAVGPFRDRIVHLESATPLTHQRYTLSTAGTSYGILHSPGQTGPFRPQYATHIDGLYLVGQSTSGGHGIIGTFLGGLGCMKAIDGVDYRQKALDGERLVADDLLGDDPDDWDAMLVSRGEAMRRLRHARN